MTFTKMMVIWKKMYTSSKAASQCQCLCSCVVCVLQQQLQQVKQRRRSHTQLPAVSSSPALGAEVNKTILTFMMIAYVFSLDVCSCTFKNMWTDTYQPACWHSLLLHTHCVLLDCRKRHTLDNCLGHNHPQIHYSVLLGQQSDELCWKTRDWACFYGVGLDICANTVNAVTYQLSLCIYLLNCCVEPRRTINTYQTIVSPLYDCLFSQYHCFEVKNRTKHVSFSTCKETKGIGKKKRFDPIFRSELAQKVFVWGFVIRGFPSQSSEIDADVFSFVLHCSLSVSVAWLPSAQDKGDLVRTRWDQAFGLIG